MRNTKQRDTVLKIVEEACDHPSAETIYNRARTLIPDISLGTVYRNLKLLVELGKIREVAILNAGDRYDKTLGVHAHFHCTRCGEVTDVLDLNLDGIESEISAKTGNKIEGADVLFTGICKRCKNECIV